MNRTARLGPAAVIATFALPALAVAEGNRLDFACAPLDPTDHTMTDESGAQQNRPAFTIAPVKTDRDGSGQIEATMPDGRTAPGVTASHQGPFAWTLETTLHTLTVEGETADGRALVLWHQLDQAQEAVPPQGALTKLLCEVS